MKDHHIDMGPIYKDPYPKDLINLGVKIGAAKHVISDIDEWKQSRKWVQIFNRLAALFVTHDLVNMVRDSN